MLRTDIALPLSIVLLLTLIAPAQADDWPQWGGPQRDGVWREKGIVDKLPSKLKVRWRTPIGAGYSSPSIADGRVFVSDRVLTRGEKNPDNPFDRRRVRGSERVLCLNEKTGKEIWKHEYPCEYAVSYGSGPRAAPTVDGDRVYALGAMGDLFCFETKSGKILWQKNYVQDFGTEINTWGMSASPLVDGDQLILLVGGKGKAGVVSLDKTTGKERWRALEISDPGYCPPTIIEAGGKRQLIVWTPRELVALAPADGQIYWKQDFKIKAALSIPTPIHDPKRQLLFVTAFYDGPMMMKLQADSPAASLLWKGQSQSERKTEGLHAIMCTPVFKNGYIYGVCSYGQLRCLEAKTGKRVWETLEATGTGRWWNAFITPHENRYFISNEQGELITAKLTPKGYQETSRSFLIEPTNRAQRRKVVWSHPAFANRSVYARNDKEIICVDLSAK